MKDQNVQEMNTVRTIWHVIMKNVSILVNVLCQPNVLLITMFQHVDAHLVLMEIQRYLVRWNQSKY